MKLAHFGIVTKEIEQGVQFLADTLGVVRWTDVVTDELQKVHARFGQDNSGVIFEVVAPTDEASPVSRVLSKKVDVLNHIAYRVKDIDAQARRLRKNGCLPIGPKKPGVAFGGKDVQFFITSQGWLLELIEQWDDKHFFEQLA